MKTDTSTTAGKIEIMLHFTRGGTIQFDNADQSSWIDFNKSEGEIDWDWNSYNYRIKPKTVGEAAEVSVEGMYDGMGVSIAAYKDGFKDGAKWRENQPE